MNVNLQALLHAILLTWNLSASGSPQHLRGTLSSRVTALGTTLDSFPAQTLMRLLTPKETNKFSSYPDGLL
ncbi:hypothetical protein K435DRAFT_62541 [Dendrothele bispora CBS 962.96]|uniref:Uncharacterized protein n=1 Tax=Dendrothele bispora (strain CBS 962.96) TaxID=1314807 RepID=A0A4S8M5I3_DENBC|nr:hypothetical protein K435DRAFT_62541 [Dendrothele bispora CBS 962.96]